MAESSSSSSSSSAPSSSSSSSFSSSSSSSSSGLCRRDTGGADPGACFIALFRAGDNDAAGTAGPESQVVREADGDHQDGRVLWDPNTSPTHAFDSQNFGVILNVPAAGSPDVSWKVKGTEIHYSGVTYGTILEIQVVAGVAGPAFRAQWVDMTIVFRQGGTALPPYVVPGSCLASVPAAQSLSAAAPTGRDLKATPAAGPAALAVPVPAVAMRTIITVPSGVDSFSLTATARIAQTTTGTYAPPVDDEAVGQVHVYTTGCEAVSSSSSSSSSSPSSSSSAPPSSSSSSSSSAVSSSSSFSSFSSSSSS